MRSGGTLRAQQLEVLYRSAVVLITAIWEAYCEDITAEALEHLLENIRSSADLPTEMKKAALHHLKDDKHELAAWRLSDDGWKEVTRGRLQTILPVFHTPKSENVEKLMRDTLGLKGVSEVWKWPGMSAARARGKLDRYVTLRGAIAHRGRGASTCTKAQVEDYYKHVRRLASKTGGRIRRHIKSITGTELW